MAATPRKRKTSPRAPAAAKHATKPPAKRATKPPAKRATKPPAKRATKRDVEAAAPPVSRIVEIRQLRGSLRVSIDLARHDFAVPQPSARNQNAAAREAELLNLPLKEALARLVDEFSLKYCARLMAIEGGNMRRAALRAHYSERGLRDILQRVGLRPTAKR